MKTSQDQSGIVSIFVTMLLIVIMSLLVMAFAQVSRREQRESLDSQLSSQAYYAAETGINDAKSAISNFIGANPGIDLPSRSSCNDNANYSELNDPNNKNLKIDGSVGYTCVTVNPTPPYLSATVGDQSQILPVKMADGNPVNNLTVRWTGTTDWAAPTAAQMNQCSNAGSFPANTNGCPYGGLRVDLVPTDGAISRTNLNNNTLTAFLMPRKSAGAASVQYLTGGRVTQGFVVNANNCNNGACTVQFSGLGGRSYYMRITRLYLGSQVRITNGGRVFKDSQATIDSTGKAQDVLRRVLVSVPLQSGQGITPTSALISGDSICKRFEVYDGFIAQGFTGTFPGSNNNPLCEPVLAAGGGAPSPTGDAEFTKTNPNSSGTGSTGTGGPYYGRTYYNISDNPDSMVVSCVWNWGDGTISTTACHNGDSIQHTYPTTVTCVTYTIVLTVKLTNGTSPKYTSTVKEPHGSASGC
jgi:Tfp pilus assembly protein PilX